MTALAQRPGNVVEASASDLRQAVAHALTQAGCASFEELAAQARTGRFSSTKARMAWVAVGGLGEYA